MITHVVAAGMCRRAAARIRELAEAAYPGPWISDEDDNCWRLHSAPDPHFPTAQILKAPKHGTPYAEYWPDEATGAHIVAWSPPPALAVADMLELVAEQIDTAAEFGMPLPGIYLCGVRMAEAFLLAQPAVPDDPEEIKRQFAGLVAKVVAKHEADPTAAPRRSLFWADLDRRLEDPEFREAYVAESLRIRAFDTHANGEDGAQ